MTTLKEVLDAHHGGTRDDLEAALLAREDNIADMIRLAGAQFGLYPEIVAEVLATVGLGTPLTEENRALIRYQFLALMEALRIQQQNNEGGTTPPEGAGQ